MAFAKLYGDDDSQVLALRDDDETEEPGSVAGIKVLFQPPGLGVCAVRLGYKTFDDADAAWANVTEERVRGIAAKASEQLAVFAEDDDG